MTAALEGYNYENKMMTKLQGSQNWGSAGKEVRKYRCRPPARVTRGSERSEGRMDGAEVPTVQCWLHLPSAFPTMLGGPQGM